MHGRRFPQIVCAAHIPIIHSVSNGIQCSLSLLLSLSPFVSLRVASNELARSPSTREMKTTTTTKNRHQQYTRHRLSVFLFRSFQSKRCRTKSRQRSLTRSVYRSAMFGALARATVSSFSPTESQMSAIVLWPYAHTRCERESHGFEAISQRIDFSQWVRHWKRLDGSSRPRRFHSIHSASQSFGVFQCDFSNIFFLIKANFLRDFLWDLSSRQSLFGL